MTTRTDTQMPDDQLPPDPDVDVSDPRPVMRPVHLRWRYLGLVALGGTVGTALRDIISSLLPADNRVSWSIFWINITGALLLGLLLEALAHRGPDEGRRRVLRLLLGTGVLGGFTTYSTLAESTAALFLGGHGLAGTGYALLTVLAGAIATACGLVIASWIRPQEVHA
uniref:Fluoride-specific ion channel FluC n=1 Tax=Neobacillus citreus TaxID=2833578 RepID=A0A942Y800_9BACI